MPNDEPEDKSRSRRQGISPEQRRLLGQAPSRHDVVKEKDEEAAKPAPLAERPISRSATPPREPRVEEIEDSTADEIPPLEETAAAKPEWSTQLLRPDNTQGRKSEIQKVVFIIGGLILLAGIFYAGRRFDYLKYLVMTWSKPKLPEAGANKFPGASSEQLIAQALASERIGNWHDAIERFVAAKQRNRPQRGILFHAGKLCYDHNDFISADKLFEYAITFGENVEPANYYRALIAASRNDFSSAAQLLEAASKSDPFVPGYYFKWGEVLRRDHHPAEAITRYEQALVHAPDEQYTQLCKFKIRQARMEAADTPRVSSDLEQARRAGPLSVDWLMTAAALQIRGGKIAEAVAFLDKAHTEDEPRMFTTFAACVGDMEFMKACQDHPDLAVACRVVRPTAESAR